MKKGGLVKVVSVAVSATMIMNCAGGGIASAATSLFALVAQDPLPPPFSARPTQPWYGENPGRELRTRGGFYSERALVAIELAAQKWRRTSGGGDAQNWQSLIAGDSPVALTGLSVGGGSGIPGEGQSGNGIGGGGVVNTVNGNMMKPFGLVSWPSRGELAFGVNLYHNSVTDYNLEFGSHWSFNYGAKLDLVASQTLPVYYHATIRWGDGTVVYFENDGNDNYTAPAGCFDDLELTGGGNYIVTAPDLFEFEFTPPNTGITDDLGDLVAVRDRNGNQITVTISTVNGQEVPTKVEDCVTSRYVELDYNSTTHRVETIEDHTGRIWEFVYDDGEDDLTEIVYPELDSTLYSRVFTYVSLGGAPPNSTHLIETETDLNDKVWEYGYYLGKLDTATNPLSKTTTYTYNSTYTEIEHPDSTTIEHHYSSGLLSMEVDEDTFNRQYKDYNADRLVTLLQDERGNYWEFDYNGKGNITEVTDPLSHTTTYAYEANGSDINTITNHEGDVWNLNYYLTGAKNLKEVYDPENRRLRLYDYNAYGDVDSAKDADDEETTIAYGADGYLSSVTNPLAETFVVELDVLGRPVWIEDPIQASTTGTSDDRTDFTYDEWGRQTVVTHPLESGDDETRYTTQYNYDEEDNLLSVIDERGKTVSLEYDDAGQLTDIYNQKNEHEQYVRNDRGWVSQVINGRGKSRYNTYTGRGELYHYRFYLGGINYEGEVYTHDGIGNTTLHGYYKWGLSSTGEYKYYTYDDANRMTLVDYDTGSMTDVSFEWDDADRMIEMVDGTGTTEWTYVDGDLTEMVSPQGTIQYGYDANARLDELTEVIPGGSDIITTYTYDEAGRTETVDKFGETTTFEYDDASRPEKMIYDTGAYALYTYDGRSRIKAIEHKNSSNTLLRKETNTYDAASRITSRYEGPASGGVTTTCGYDDAGQLTSESSSGYSATYAYDANGNRTNRTVNGVSETYTVDDADKLTSVTWSSGGNNYEKAYAYHYSGRPTSITYKTNSVTQATETMTWDKESRMLTNSLANASYVYNGFDARVSKTVSSTTTTFKRAGADAVSPLVSDAIGGTTTNYVPGVSSRTGGSSTFSHTGVKNGILQTNASQTNTATKRYDAFGNELSTSGTWQTRFDYSGDFGYQRDDESGYRLLGHRYYDPEIGRFLTRDPIKDGRNCYAYCENDPVSSADSDGLSSFWIIGIRLLDAGLSAWDIYNDPGDPWNWVGIGIPGKGLLKAAKRGANAFIDARKAVKFRSFTERNFRENLKRYTGKNPPSHIEAHHGIPKKKIIQDAVQKVGINIHDPKYGRWWNKNTHQKIAKQYNDDWEEFLRKNEGTLTKKKVEDYLREQDKRYAKYYD